MKCSICKKEIYGDEKWLEVVGFSHHKSCGSELVKQPKIIKNKGVLD